MLRVVAGAVIVAVVGTLTACGGSGGVKATPEMQKEVALYQIDQIEKTWHKAASTQDVDLMMSIWAPTTRRSRSGRQTLRRQGADPELLRHQGGAVPAREPLGLGHARLQDPDHGQR